MNNESISSQMSIKTDVSFAFEADDAFASGIKEVDLLAAKFPPRCPLCCLLRFCRERNARVHLTFLLTEMYGCNRLCDRLRSSAIIWKQLSLRSSVICDLRSAIVCDRLRSYGNQPLMNYGNATAASADT